MTTPSPLFSLTPHHVAISVPDLERAIAWYGEMLGFELEKRDTLPQVPAKVAFLVRDGFRIEVFELAKAAALPDARRVPDQDLRTHGTKHIAFSVTQVADVVEELRRRGVVIAMEPRSIGSVCVAFVNDDSGNLIEFVQET